MSTRPDLSRSLWVRGAGVDLHVVLHFDPDDEVARRKPVVLFVHGFPDDHHTWSLQTAALASEMRVATVDMRGAGRSSHPADPRAYHTDDLCADLDAVIDAIAPGEQVHLVGHDWGGMTLWRYVGTPQRAARTASLTVIAAPHLDLMVPRLQKLLREEGLWGLRRAIDQLRRSWYIFCFRVPWLPERTWSTFTGPMWRRTVALGNMEGDSEMAGATRTEVLSRVLGPLNLYRQMHRGRARELAVQSNLPVQLLVCRNDGAIAPFLFDGYEQWFPRLRRRDFPTNHWGHRERADLFNAAVRDAVSGAAWAADGEDLMGVG